MGEHLRRVLDALRTGSQTAGARGRRDLARALHAIQAAATKCRYCGELLVKRRNSARVPAVVVLAAILATAAIYVLQNSPNTIQSAFSVGSSTMRPPLGPPVVVEGQVGGIDLVHPVKFRGSGSAQPGVHVVIE